MAGLHWTWPSSTGVDEANGQWLAMLVESYMMKKNCLYDWVNTLPTKYQVFHY